MDGKKIHRLGTNKHGKWFMVYILDTTLSKIFKKHGCPNDTECLFTELDFKKCNWVLHGTYHPPSLNDITLIILVNFLSNAATVEQFCLQIISIKTTLYRIFPLRVWIK